VGCARRVRSIGFVTDNPGSRVPTGGAKTLARPPTFERTRQIPQDQRAGPEATRRLIQQTRAGLPFLQAAAERPDSCAMNLQVTAVADQLLARHGASGEPQSCTPVYDRTRAQSRSEVHPTPIPGLIASTRKAAQRSGTGSSHAEHALFRWQISPSSFLPGSPAQAQRRASDAAYGIALERATSGVSTPLDRAGTQV